MSPPKKHKHHPEQPPKMAEMLLYGSLPHDGCWPLHGQKSCYKKCDRTEMGARTPRPIPTNAVAERNGLIARKRPHQTGHVFVPSHHHHTHFSNIPVRFGFTESSAHATSPTRVLLNSEFARYAREATQFNWAMFEFSNVVPGHWNLDIVNFKRV